MRDAIRSEGQIDRRRSHCNAQYVRSATKAARYLHCHVDFAPRSDFCAVDARDDVSTVAARKAAWHRQCEHLTMGQCCDHIEVQATLVERIDHGPIEVRFVSEERERVLEVRAVERRDEDQGLVAGGGVA